MPQKPMVGDDEKRLLSTIHAEHEPSISSYGDVACLCGEEFRAGETRADSGYHQWSEHVIAAFEREGNALAALRDVDSAYR
jgi:hypothetical protein